MNPIQSRISLQVSAARKLRSLARRFAAKGDTFNANQSRLVAMRAMNAAREIKYLSF